MNRIHVQEGDELKGEGRPAPRFTACRLLPMSEEDFPIDCVDSGMPSSPLPFRPQHTTLLSLRITHV